jgi:hypothetical protein
MNITGTMIGDQKVVQLFDADKLPQELYDGLLASIRKSTAEMEAIVRGRVPTMTGHLASMIESKVAKGKDFISGTVVTTGGAKAIALEYGATGRSKTAVRAHTMKLAHAWAQIISPKVVQIAAFNRVQNIAPHPFMRPAFDAVKASAASDMASAANAFAASATSELNSN